MVSFIYIELLNMYGHPPQGHCSTGYLSQVPPWVAPIWRYQHMNNTTNETAGNETAEDGNITALIETVEESGMLDAIMDEPLLMALVAVVLGMGGYIAYTVPAVKELVFKYIKEQRSRVNGHAR